MKKLVLTMALFVVALVPVVFAADTPGPAPYSLEALTGQVSGLLFGSRETPAVALTPDQAQKIVPLLKQWQANLYLDPAAAKAVWTQFQAVLTPEQIAFKPVRPTRQPGTAGGTPGNGTPGGNRPAGSRPAATPGTGTGTYQERQSQLLDRLIQRLEKL